MLLGLPRPYGQEVFCDRISSSRPYSGLTIAQRNPLLNLTGQGYWIRYIVVKLFRKDKNILRPQTAASWTRCDHFESAIRFLGEAKAHLTGLERNRRRSVIESGLRNLVLDDPLTNPPSAA